MKQLILFKGPKYSTLKYFFLIWLTSVWFVIELLLLVIVMFFKAILKFLVFLETNLKF